MHQDDQSQTFEINTHGGPTRTVGPGNVLGGVYLLKAKLGQGGMGCVFSAEHQLLKKVVAVKLIALDQINDETWRRFELEGRTIAKMEHPAIVKIYDMAISDDCPFYAMDLLDGIALAELTERKKVAPVEILEIFKALAEGFAYAHGKGVIHRDIKPTNVILVANDKGKLSPKILDFGIAKVIDKSSTASQSQTRTGMIVGSPLYMSPEQAQGEICDARSDIYSLGCTLFEVLSGQPLFKGASAMQTMMMHQEAPVPRLEQDAHGRELPVGTDNLMAKMLAKSKAQRYQSMSQVAHDLERIIAGRPVGVAAPIPDGQAESLEGMPAVASAGAGNWMVPAAVAIFIVSGGIASYVFWHGQQKQSTPPTVSEAHKISAADVIYAPSIPANLSGANYYKGANIEPPPELHPRTSPEYKTLMAVKEIPVQRNYQGDPQKIAIQFPSVAIGAIGTAVKSTGARGLVVQRLGQPIGLEMDVADYAPAIFYPHVLSYLPKDVISDISLSGLKDSLLATSTLSKEDAALLPAKFGEILKIAVTWKRLRRVNLENMSLKNIDIAAIMLPVKHLDLLELRAVRDISDENLAKSKLLQNVDWIFVLGGTNVPKSMIAIAHSHNLRAVNLSGNKLTAEIADALARAPSLISLELNERFDVDSSIIEHLCASKTLKRLAILDAPLRPETIADLAKIKGGWKLEVKKDPCNEAFAAKLTAQGVKFIDSE